MRQSIILQFLALASYQVISGAAQNSSCNTSTSLDTGPFRDGYNATGSVSFPGFRVNESYPESTWTFSQYIVDDYSDTNNRSELWSTIGLETSPVQNLLDPSLPYSACIWALQGKATNKITSDGSCDYITSACVSEIIAQVNQTASQFSNTKGASDPSGSLCPTLLGTIGASSSSACHGLVDGWFSARFMPSNFSTLVPQCPPATNPGASNASSKAFFSWGDSNTRGVDNYTFYDAKIRNPQPVIVSAFLKDAGGIGNTLSWADTRLLCLPGNVTAPGSRSVTEAEKTSGAERSGGSVSLLGVVVLTVMVALF